MFIEDLIDRLACEGNYMFSSSLSISSNDFKLMSSFSTQIAHGRGLTEKQKNYAIKILKKYSSILSAEFGVDINPLLTNPAMKFPTRVIPQSRNITIEKDENSISYIIARFPYDKEIIDKIILHRRNSTALDRNEVNWDADNKYWKFALTEQNICFLSSWQNFQMDEKLLEYFKEIAAIQQQIENYVPMVTLDNNKKFIYKNVSKNIPTINSDNLIEVLLIARKYGVTCWSEEIDAELDKIINNTVKSFLRSNYSDKVINTKTPITFDEVEEIIRYYENILFIIPCGSELKYLKGTYENLISKNYKNESMAVLFRLAAAQDQLNCNKFIHDNSLNNPISDKTTLIFVSGKIPKPLIETNKKFDLVINFGTSSAHYTLQNFLKNHHNVVTMISTPPHKDWNYAYV